MNLYFGVGVGLCAAALLFVAVNALLVLWRVLAVARRARTIRSHPTLMRLKEVPSIASRMSGLHEALAEIRARSLRIAQSVAEFAAATAVLDLDVDRVSFATRLLLETFVPKLRGSLAD